MREFNAEDHLINIPASRRVQLRDGLGADLVGVTGHPGPRVTGFGGQAIGVDEITMLPGTRFDLHEHEGDHMLYVLEGRGGITIGGELHELSSGDAVFVPAECPHGVTTVDGASHPFRFISFGVPHHRLDDDERMHLVTAEQDHSH